MLCWWAQDYVTHRSDWVKELMTVGIATPGALRIGALRQHRRGLLEISCGSNITRVVPTGEWKLHASNYEYCKYSNPEFPIFVYGPVEDPVFDPEGKWRHDKTCQLPLHLKYGFGPSAQSRLNEWSHDTE